ncbi:hypothetical protein D3C73_709200 [compost metagenome]
MVGRDGKYLIYNLLIYSEPNIRMIEKVGHIKNPLTVISVFAGIAEISGTVVLPFIDANNQATYIWFLMLFPPFLVGIFFATLNWNHKTLYAPSDYQNEENFVNPVGKLTSMERVVKLQEEVDEVVADTINPALPEQSALIVPPNDAVKTSRKPGVSGESASKTVSEPSENLETQSKYSIREPSPRPYVNDTAEAFDDSQKDFTKRFNKTSTFDRAKLSTDIKLTEQFAINRIEQLTGLRLTRGMKFLTEDGKSVLFDAAVIKDKNLYAVEAKLFRNNFNLDRIAKILFDCQAITEDTKFNINNLSLFLVVVVDAQGAVLDSINEKILRLVQLFKFDVQLHLFNIKEVDKNL